MLDAGSFDGIPAAAERVDQPAPAQLDAPVAFDDGVAVGRGASMGGSACSSPRRKAASWAARSAKCMAPSWSACCARRREKADAVLLLLETGGVRLHEANAGLIAVSEVMRAVLERAPPASR
jgi:malonate decarboxylase beta subunit